MIFTIYSRPGCHLCEQMATDLKACLANAGDFDTRTHDNPNVNPSDNTHDIVIKNIEDDVALLALHRLRIPVLEVNGTEICFGRLDQQALTEYLNQ